MKRHILTIALGLLALCASANDSRDAFKGVWPVTDPAMKKSLDGEWQLKVVKGVGNDQSVPAADASWGTIPVPGCWEAYGFCEPKYDYPDSLTGYYRTEFTVPEAWRGQQVYIRLDGVLRGYDLWLNDHYVGTWESAYNTCLFDLTPYLRKTGRQQLAMRVYTRFKGYEFDCFDDWATNGIFRDVTLMAVPPTHLSDLTVTTRMNGEVTVRTEVAGATKHTTVEAEIIEDGKLLQGTNLQFSIPNPRLWTAETPYLYTLRVRVKEKQKVLQTFTQKIGIKEVSVGGHSASPFDSVKNVLMLNGRPVKLRGVNAHSTDPRTVKVIGDTLTLKDMRMMKEASVNYMRLSHYPREPRFYELADSLGFYLVSEVPFGYGDKHLGSRSYQDILYTRANATLRRDKNHPSVLVWSVGNENPLPQTCVEVGDSVGRLDPSRPYCYPQVGSYFRRFWEKAGQSIPSGQGPSPFPSAAPIYAPHYPTTGQIGGFYQHLDRPVIFTEYCHTLGQSFEDHDRQWDIIERTPGIAGGSVWEWADQGMPFKATLSYPLVGKPYGYEERVYTVSPEGERVGEADGFEMYGNKGTDGLVYADRTPLPNYYELQHNYARAFVTIDHSPLTIGHSGAQTASADNNGQWPIVNVQCVNRYDFLNLKDNVFFRWALTADRDTVACGTFSPDCAPHDSVDHTLHLPHDVVLGKENLQLLHFTLIDAQGHVFLRQNFVLNKPELQWTGTGDPMALVQQGPLVRTGRKPTLAERIKQAGRLPERYLLPLESSEVAAEVKTVATTDGGQDVAYVLTPDTADVFRAELGLAYLLDPAIDRVQWIGQGPFASYPGRHQSCRYGFWAKHKDDLYFEGNHQGVDACWLSDKDGNGVLITGNGLDVNFEQTDRGVVVTVNAAVSGLGPKFARTAFNGWKPGDGPVSAHFAMRRTESGQCPRLFLPADAVPAPFHPFCSQYDTYLMRYDEIVAERSRTQ